MKDCPFCGHRAVLVGVRSDIRVQTVHKIPFGVDKGQSHKTSRSHIRGSFVAWTTVLQMKSKTHISITNILLISLNNNRQWPLHFQTPFCKPNSYVTILLITHLLIYVLENSLQNKTTPLQETVVPNLYEWRRDGVTEQGLLYLFIQKKRAVGFVPWYPSAFWEFKPSI